MREIEWGNDSKWQSDRARAALADHSASRSVAEDRGALLAACLERMDRARRILADGNPRPECNWGMLDTSDIRATPPQPASPDVAKMVGEAKRLAAFVAMPGGYDKCVKAIDALGAAATQARAAASEPLSVSEREVKP